MDEQKEILLHLRTLGCCVNCCMRYMCDKYMDFSDQQVLIEKFSKITGTEPESECTAKKSKPNACTICLGLLQDFTIDYILNHEDLLKVQDYDSEVFTVSISYPASIILREFSMRQHLVEKFPRFFTDETTETYLNRAWKMFIKGHVAKSIGKQFNPSDCCEFSINVAMEYCDDVTELSILKEMQPELFQSRVTNHRKYNGELFTRKGVISALSKTRSGIFKMHAKIPPEVPVNSLTCKTIECKHGSVYLAGRYCKFSRELSQSPWVIDGERMMESSVQEIIFDKIAEVIKVPTEKMKFSSSGREDCDVRCLGRGRPFYVELLDPKKTKFALEDFKAITTEIDLSKLIKVTDLQIVKRNDLTKIKEGEEMKTKTYMALCTTTYPVDADVLNKINKVGSLEIDQKTPVRVLHRRPLATRKRNIIQMEASPIEGYPKCFNLLIETQAGTYVKEFVHGDFGRTKPNVGDILGTPGDVDIAALDVLSIELDWPPPVQ